ncbi:predicted protein [Nematostella vectensis]|uniref:Transmembrane protein 5 n=1 Tax=Nematostella vectensis TaxID=45351 RepID=A7SP89_NEMVE|nr:ribitol-5-phosphate xylosyltransferase 1 [Nematostella vectensis]EDO34485.1 predicted protein [Nematostella vectensis]|eukprot:XP_001626585.1 predicted protein [Nematostella vectensis]
MKWKIFIAAFLIVYSIITIYTTNRLLSRDNGNNTLDFSLIGRRAGNFSSVPQRLIDVEIWGKAGIALYLWEHVIQGDREQRLGGIWSYGKKEVGPFRFQFRTGPGVAPNKVPKETENLVLVLNGREPQKVEFAQAWLESLRFFSRLRNVAVILLGSETCANEWFLPYLKTYGGVVNVAFIIYDIPEKDERSIFQWPLGVATYREFPNVPPLSVEVEMPRKYICNFLGTIYNNSSRVVLKKVLDSFKYIEDGLCYVNFREKWNPSESQETSQQYYYALANSDLTLSPVGINTECYRIYEACSYGSVPVIEDVMTPGKCGGKENPLYILKKYKAPFIFIKHWTELPKIIEKEQLMSTYELSDRRKTIINWYNKFKEQLRLHFVKVLKEKFVQ